MLQLFGYRDKPLSSYLTRGIVYRSLSGLFSNLGTWRLFESLKCCSKALIVSPFCTVYPLPIVLLAFLLRHESITLGQRFGMACALAAVVLISQGMLAEAKSNPETVTESVRDSARFLWFD